MTSIRVVRWGVSPAVVRMISLALMLVAAPGCGVLPANVNQPLQLYTLTPKTTFEETLPKVDWQLVVEQPNAAAALDTWRVALSRSPYTIEYYSNATWTENAPAMIQTLLIESFESTRSIVAVGREAIGLRPDFILQTDLREFQAVYDENSAVPTAWVRLNAKLVKMPERRIIASQTFERRVAASGRSFNDVIEAFDTALGGVLKQIVLFTLSTPPASIEGDA